MRRRQRVLLMPLVVHCMASVLLALTCAGHPAAVPEEPGDRERASATPGCSGAGYTSTAFPMT